MTTLNQINERSPIPALLGDPDLTYFDGKYWLYATNDGNEGWVNSTINSFTSTDLISWADLGPAYDSETSVKWPRAPKRTWAPAVLHLGPNRHILYTAEDGNIACAVSDSPSGPFVDIGHPLVPAGAAPGYQIDPAVFTDQDGVKYLLWGNSIAHMAPLGPDGTTIDLSRVHSWTPPGFTEAIDIKLRNGKYHATWSVGDTRDPDYHVDYATSHSPFGPWRHHGTLLKPNHELNVLSTGHHSILNVPGTDEWILAYHRWLMNAGAGWRREVMFASLDFSDDGLMEPIQPRLEWFAKPLA